MLLAVETDESGGWSWGQRRRWMNSGGRLRRQQQRHSGALAGSHSATSGGLVVVVRMKQVQVILVAGEGLQQALKTEAVTGQQPLQTLKVVQVLKADK